MIYSVHQPQYIPWLGYFHKIAESDIFVILDNVQYKQREFQNRNKIRTKLGWIWLAVPVITKGKRYQLIKDVRIDNSLDWRRRHKNSLKTWYGKAKYFDKYFAQLEQLYNNHRDRLCDINIEIIKFLLSVLEIKSKIYLESSMNIETKSTKRIIEIGKTLKADVYLSGAGGRDYLEENLFLDSGIKLEYQDFVHPQYTQLYSHNSQFIPFLSVIDLIFNHGKSSMDILMGRKYSDK